MKRISPNCFFCLNLDLSLVVSFHFDDGFLWKLLYITVNVDAGCCSIVLKFSSTIYAVDRLTKYIFDGNTTVCIYK